MIVPRRHPSSSLGGPTVVTAYSLDNPDLEQANEEERKQNDKNDKEKILLILLGLNAVILMTLIFMLLIPIHKGRNCYNRIPFIPPGTTCTVYVY